MASREITDQWIALAQEDFELAARLINEGWFYRQALPHLQQAIEKYTKAFLILNGWKLRKIHDLETLFDEASRYDFFFKKYLDMGRELTAYYTETRYPPLLENEPSKSDAKRLLTLSRKFIAKLRKKLSPYLRR